ncbi:hypothetical protein FOCG_07369 [Fusarium oxysporum f. sp. radicis-lycopersici 26381]|uniref:Uncharacterized protein n=1 Tax=Fusarium oxysporum TaxID=5507 RepID=A0A8H5ADK4_FUSOX|nr:hypothetical protein FOCG_07369 [Fusarium oxysporum f. sp. radicis-lycopersici 26381]KAF5261300.1 hypothetical protein FOXYS1_8015 [Fusarium oxysporum]
MSKTSTSTAASQTACADIYNTPNQDNVCAMFRKDNHTDIMQACCGEAKIISYSGDCGLYCVALDQTIDQLSKCLYDHGAPDEKGVWCSGNSKTTKTKDANIPATARATVISDDDDEKDKDKGDDKSTSTGTASSSKSSETSNAAANTSPQFVTTTLGLTIGALVLSSMAIGAFEL